MSRRSMVLGTILFVVISASMGYWWLTSAPPSQRQARGTAVTTKPLPTPDSEEANTRNSVLGVWQDTYQGKRTMTLNQDGTGTMLVELQGAAALLYAAQLRFDMTWSLDGKKLTKKTIGGEPAAKVNLILNTLGDTAVDTILEISEDRLLLLDQDGKTQYDWRRAKPLENSKQ